MLKFIENFTNEHVLEHDLEHDLTQKIKFSDPKIYHANKDISKRWYVYFSYRNPETGKMQRMQNIYGTANKHKTKEDRLAVLTTYRKVLLKLLKEGFNPFEDNSALIKSRKEKPKAVKVESKEPEETKETRMPLNDAIAFGLELKKVTLSSTSYRSFKSHILKFNEWMTKEQPQLKYLDQLDKKTVVMFLNEILKNSSARNRNNYRIDLSSLVQLLFDNDLLTSNFVKQIPVLKTTPKRNKKFTHQQDKEILHYLEKEDPLLLLFIKFVSINFLRPIEVCRLKVKDLNIEQKEIQFKAKNSPLKTKLIPKLLLDDLPDLSKMNSNLDLFTPNEIGGEWDISPDNKRNYFSKRFKKVVKEKFGLGQDYGLYSYRHTYITKVYRELLKVYSPHEAKSRLMQITGHSSMKALETYLRDIDAALPADYSNLITQGDNPS